MDNALGGLKVLDLTHHVAGPYCTRLLALLGAEVTKIERPQSGDPARRAGPFPLDEPDNETSGLFLFLNASKKSVTLNLKSSDGIELFKQLVMEADILMESFSPRVMLDMGLGYESLRALNPGLIMTSISSFGQDGPYRDYKATNMILDALSGGLYLRGQIGRPPVHIGFSIAEYFGGETAFVATMTALYGRDRHGTGQHVDVSILDALVNAQELLLALYSQQGVVPNRNYGNVLGMPFMPCEDGYLHVAARPGQWEDLLPFLEMPELEDPRFATAAGRSKYAGEIEALVRAWARNQKKVDVFESGQGMRLLTSYIATTGDLVENRQNKSRDYFVEIEHPRLGTVTYPGAPFKMSQTPLRVMRAAPLLGEHNEEVFCDRLGLSKEDVVRMRQAGAT